MARSADGRHCIYCGGGLVPAHAATLFTARNYDVPPGHLIEIFEGNRVGNQRGTAEATDRSSCRDLQLRGNFASSSRIIFEGNREGTEEELSFRSTTSRKQLRTLLQLHTAGHLHAQQSSFKTFEGNRKGNPRGNR